MNIIWELVTYLTLICPILYLGYKYYYDFYYENIHHRFRLTTIISVLLFIIYIIFLFVYGPENIEKQIGKFEKEQIAHVYILPGIGFAFAAFPYQAAEVSSNYADLYKEFASIFALLGWGLILLLVLKLSIFKL